MFSTNEQIWSAGLANLHVRGHEVFASQFCERRASAFFVDNRTAVSVSRCAAMVEYPQNRP